MAAAGLVEQSLFLAEQERGGEGSSSDHYVLPWEVKEVAIIGAGVSWVSHHLTRTSLIWCRGLLAYQALAETGRFSRIRIFERDSHPGGNWHYSDEVPVAVPIAKGRESDWWKADYDPTPPVKLPAYARYGTRGNHTWTEELEAERRAHRQPKPIWKSLKANTPAPQQEASAAPIRCLGAHAVGLGVPVAAGSGMGFASLGCPTISTIVRFVAGTQLERPGIRGVLQYEGGDNYRADNRRDAHGLEACAEKVGRGDEWYFRGGVLERGKRS